MGYVGGEEIDDFSDVGYLQSIHLDQLNCTGASSIDECEHNDWGRHDCSHSEDVGIRKRF